MNRILSATLITISALVYSNITLAADMGPFYITYDDYCDVFELYITPELNVYGREIGCEMESVIVTGSFNGTPGNPTIPLHYHANDGEYMDVINLRTGSSDLYFSNGTDMAFIVETAWKVAENDPQ